MVVGVFLGVVCEHGRIYQLFFLVHKFFVLDCFIPEGVEGKADGVTFC